MRKCVAPYGGAVGECVAPTGGGAVRMRCPHRGAVAECTVPTWGTPHHLSSSFCGNHAASGTGPDSGAGAAGVEVAQRDGS